MAQFQQFTAGIINLNGLLNIIAGKKVTLFAAAVTTPPPLILSAVATAFGAAEITALLANGKLPGETDALIQVEDSAWTGTTAQARPQTGSKPHSRPTPSTRSPACWSCTTRPRPA